MSNGCGRAVRLGCRGDDPGGSANSDLPTLKRVLHTALVCSPAFRLNFGTHSYMSRAGFRPETASRRFPLAKDAEGAKNGWAGRGLLGDLGALGERVLWRGSEIRSHAETRRARRLILKNQIRGAAGRPKGADL